MSTSWRRPAPLAPLVPLALLVAGCAGAGGGPDTAPGAVEVTPLALGAAAIAHYDRPFSVGTALVTGRDVYPPAPTGSTGAQMVFDFSSETNVSIRVLVSEDDLDVPYGGDRCRVWECVDVGDDETDARLSWTLGAPEEDPGGLVGWADSPGRHVRVLAVGPFISEQHDEPGMAGLADAVEAILLDPAVAPRTSEAYADAGEALCDGDDWLDWYGQDNGSRRPPPGYVDWCGRSDQEG